MRNLILLVAGCTLLTASGWMVKKEKLQYRFQPGDHYHLYQESAQEIEQDIMGMPQTITTSIIGEMDLDVKEVKAEQTTLDLRFTKIYLKMDNPMSPMLMDSESTDSNDLMTKLAKAITRQPFSMTLASTGEILELSGGDELTDGVMATFEGLPQMQEMQIRGFLQQMYSAEQMKSNFSDFLVQYPAETIDPQESWRNETPLTALGVVIENNWKLGKKNKKAKTQAIAGEGVVVAKDAGKVLDLPNGMQASYHFSGDKIVNGNIDRKSGLIKDLNIKSNIGGTMILLKNAQIPQDLEVPMTIATETRYRVEKK